MSFTPEPSNLPGNALPGFATFLCEQREHIAAAWLENVRQNPLIPSTAGLDDAALTDHLPKLFDDLADVFRGEAVADRVAQDAETHGQRRWRQQYRLNEVLRELGAFCRLVLEHGLDAFVDAHAGLSRPEIRRARERILQFFEDTAAGSVRQYVEKQNEEREALAGQLREAERVRAVAVQSEFDRLADVFKRSPSFIAILSGPEHVFELANDRYHQLVGGSRDILHKPVREALPEIAGQGFFELLDGVYATGVPFVGNDVSINLQTQPDQLAHEHFLDFVYLPTRGPDGAITGVFVHGVDWTERKTAQRTLAQVAEQRRLALDSAQMGWWHHDLQSGRVHWDDRFKEIFGVGQTDLAYDKAISIIHPDDRARVDAALQAAIRPHDPVPYAIEYRVAHEDGTMRWALAQGKASFEGEGDDRRAVTVSGTLTDITEARAVQDALRESEAGFRRLADAMPQIVWSARPDGVLDYTNRRWYEYVQLTEAEIDVAEWHLRVHPDDVAGAGAAWAQAIGSGRPYATEFRVRRADGEYRWFLVRALPIHGEDGAIVRWYGTCTDIHGQRALLEQNARLLESERAARTEAERTGRIKDEFLATLSHELRTPLNAILGWTQVLRGEPALTGEVEQGLVTIERNTRAQKQIIDDLLDMSAIISGKVRLDVERLDLAAVIEAAVETVRPAADAKGIDVQTTIDPQARTISGDPNRLQQVFWNLLSNAIKFTPRGGRVGVALARVDSHLEVSVADSGEGIGAEFLPHVFDRFRQADASTTRRHGGLGLGLAIVKQLAELHGGSVRAESAGPGQGTTFRVHLPLAAVQPAPGPGDAERRPPGAAGDPLLTAPAGSLNLAGVKVLVVDDEADARALMRRLLEDRHARVWTAGSVGEAMELLRAERPDVLVSDIGMPGEDGYALIGQVRALASEAGGNTPAVALTAYARSEDRLKAMAAGFQVHVAKPVEATELLALVASLAERMTPSAAP